MIKRDTFGGTSTSLCANLKLFFRKQATDVIVSRKNRGVSINQSERSLYLQNIFNFALNAKKLHYGQERYKQIESGSCGTETYSKGGGRTSKTRPCDRIEMVYQYLTAKFWHITSSG